MKVKYASAPAIFRGRNPILPCTLGTTCMGRPHPGQNAAEAGIPAAHSGQANTGELNSGIFDRALLTSIHAILPPALFTNPVDLKGMSCGQIVILAADLLFELADFLRKELDRTATLSANHVVMAAAVVLMLVARNPVVKGDFTRESTVGQQLERAIHRCVSDAAIFFLHQTMQFIGRQMIPCFEERAQDRIALCGLLQSDRFKMPVQNLFRFADHFPRERRLIINAFLQHILLGTK